MFAKAVGLFPFPYFMTKEFLLTIFPNPDISHTATGKYSLLLLTTTHHIYDEHQVAVRHRKKASRYYNFLFFFPIFFFRHFQKFRDRMSGRAARGGKRRSGEAAGDTGHASSADTGGDAAAAAGPGGPVADQLSYATPQPKVCSFFLSLSRSLSLSQPLSLPPHCNI